MKGLGQIKKKANNPYLISLMMKGDTYNYTQTCVSFGRILKLCLPRVLIFIFSEMFVYILQCKNL